MPPRNPAEQLKALDVAHLTAELLKQFQRLLTQHEVSLTKAQIDHISEQVAQQQPPPDTIAAVCAAMRTIVNESVTELKTRFHFTFARSLREDMTSIGGWTTTAEFLEVANHKSNAELRISAGSTLLILLGETDATYFDYLYTVINHDAGVQDVDAVFAQRALTFRAGVDPHADDWLPQVKSWQAGLETSS